MSVKGTSDEGDIVALGYDQLVKKLYDKALHNLRLAEHSGDERAYTYLAWIYDEGLGVNRDTVVAAKYCESAIRSGDLSVCSRYARILEVSGDVRKAIEVLREGVDANDVRSLYNLGYLLSTPGTNYFSPTEAEKLLTMAASKGVPFAHRRLATIYFHRWLGRPYYAKGLVHFLKGGIAAVFSDDKN